MVGIVTCSSESHDPCKEVRGSIVKSLAGGNFSSKYLPGLVLAAL